MAKIKPLLFCDAYDPAWTVRQVKQPTGCLLFHSLILRTKQWWFLEPSITPVLFCLLCPSLYLQVPRPPDRRS